MPAFSTSWKPGDRIHSPVQSMIALDPANLSRGDTYKLLNGSIVPRPIGFVSTINGTGVCNLAPFSSFNLVSSLPPCVVFTANHHPDGRKKDTLRNIEETNEFVVNIVSEWIAAPMVWCASEYEYGVDEFKATGLTPINSEVVKPPRVKESAIHMECSLYRLVPIGEERTAPTATLVIGKVERFHVWSDLYKDGKINFEKLEPVARLGGTNYGTVHEVTSMPVPEAKK